MAGSDAGTNTVVTRVAVPSAEAFAIALNPSGSRLYLPDQTHNSLTIIDTGSNVVVGSVSVGTTPVAVAVNPPGTRAYVSSVGSNTVSVVDTAASAIVATAPVGAAPINLAVDPAGTRVYVANGTSNSVSVIDTATNSVVATIPLARPGGVAFGAAVAPSINLNQHGLTGSWFQMLTAGQGVEVEVYQDLVAPGTGFMQSAWFTYDYKAFGGSSSQRWYTFSGNVQSGQPSATLTLYENTGGNFDAPPVTMATPVGSVVVSAADCNHLTMTFSFTYGSARSGMVPMTRLLPNVTCVASGPETPNADFGYSGNWLDKTTSGQGIVFELNPNQPLAWLTWYTYAPNGQVQGEAGQRWYTAQAAYTPGARTVPMTLYETTGGLFDQSTPTPTTVPVGVATATFTSCTALQLDFNFTAGSSAGASGTINMTRVGPTPAGCGP
jgi:YVTN family beta-propeller protein